MADLLSRSLDDIMAERRTTAGGSGGKARSGGGGERVAAAAPFASPKSCYGCGKPGHISRDCPEPRGGGGGGAPAGGARTGGACYNCGGLGHLARDCPSAPGGGGGAHQGGGGGGGGGRACYTCGRPGHIARECPGGGSGGGGGYEASYAPPPPPYYGAPAHHAPHHAPPHPYHGAGGAPGRVVVEKRADRTGQHPGNDLPHSIHVSQLPFDITSDELGRIFSECGQVVHAEAAVSREGRPFGWGIVSFSTQIAQARAIASFDGAKVNERVIGVRARV